MNINLNRIAKDLYGKIETRFSDIKIGDENAEVLSKKTDIPEARFFEFEYKHNGVPLGTITITLDEDDGVVVQISGNLAEKKHPGAFKFIRGLRQFAKDRLLNFDVQNIGKDNLDKRDYEFQAKPKEETMDPIMESKLYGTNKISYQDLGEARLVIKHSQPVNLDLAAGRTMHIEGIYIENTEGERFRYPYKHLNGARALAEHIKHGGNPYDAIGKHICGLSEELAQLRKFKGYVSRNEALSEAMGDITSKVFERIEQVKKEVNMLQRSSYYEQFAESFEDREEQMIPEDIMSDWIDRLTIRTFNEELKTAFPYIFRLVDETEIPVKALSPDEMLDELRSEEKDKDGKVIRWKEEGEWKKSEKKDPKGKIFNLSDKARRETEKMSKEVSEGGWTLPPADASPEEADAIMKKNQASQDYINKTVRQNMNQKDLGDGFTLSTVGVMGGQYPAVLDTQSNTFILPNNRPDGSAIIRSIAPYILVKDGKVESAMKVGPATATALEKSGLSRPKPTAPQLTPEDQFESFLDRLMNEDEDDQEGHNTLFSKDVSVRTQAIENLKDALGNEMLTVQTAPDELKSLLPMDQFQEYLEDQDQDAGPEVVKSLVVNYLNDLSDGKITNPLLGHNAGEIASMVIDQVKLTDVDNDLPQDLPNVDAGATPAPAPATSTQPPAPDMGMPPPAPDMGAMGGAPTPGALPPIREGQLAKMKAKFIKAKEQGATLETTMDFGHRELTLHDAMKECGINPRDIGFNNGGDEGVQEILQSISGFYNRNVNEGNFTIGGTRVKTKILKAYKNGEYEHANPADVRKVCKLVDKLDPPSSTKGALSHIKKLAGLNSTSYSMAEDPEEFNLDVILKQLTALQNNPQAQNQLGQQLKQKFTTDIAPKMQAQMPNQTVDFPGGQMNPQEMMKAIMQKISQSQ
jgi:hypothetical protein